MTDHNDTGATARPWHFNHDRPDDKYSQISISNGDARIIANVVTYENTHGLSGGQANAALIVEAVNAYEPLNLAEVERQRAELASKLSHLVDSLKQAEARALAAEARIAVLEEALDVAADYIKQCDGGEPANISGWKSEELLEVWLAARTALAEQKEAGK